MGSLAIMDHTGHSILRWDQADQDSIADAEKMFAELKKQGYIAYEYSPIAAGKGRIIRKFDPYLNEVIMTPPVAGG